MRYHIECIRRTNEENGAHEQHIDTTHRYNVSHAMHASSAPNESTMARSVREETVLAMGGKRYKNVFSARSRHIEENACSRATRGNNVRHANHASNASNAQFKKMCARERTGIPMSRRRCENISSASEEQTKRMGAHEQHIDTSGCTESVDRVQGTNERRHGVFEKRRLLQLPTNNVRTYRVHQTMKRTERVLESHPSKQCGTRDACIECIQMNIRREWVLEQYQFLRGNGPQTMRYHIECIKQSQRSEGVLESISSKRRAPPWGPHGMHASSARSKQTKRMGTREQHIDTVCPMGSMHKVHPNKKRRECVIENVRVL